MVVWGAIGVFAGPAAVVAVKYSKSFAGLLPLFAAGSVAGPSTVTPFPCVAASPCAASNFAGTSALFYPAKYRLKCWKASDDTPTTFCKGPGQLFFSEKLFKWKDRVPGQ